MELEKKQIKEEKLAVLVSVWEKWHKLPDGKEFEECDSMAVKLIKELKDLGASDHEINRAEFLGTPDGERQNLLEQYARRLEGMLTTEKVVENAQSLCLIRDEFHLVDPFAERWHKYKKDHTS